MERKGRFLTFASCRFKGDKDALSLIDGLAKFASYTAAAQAEARLVRGSFDLAPASLSLSLLENVMERCPPGPDLPSIGWGAP